MAETLFKFYRVEVDHKIQDETVLRFDTYKAFRTGQEKGVPGMYVVPEHMTIVAWFEANKIFIPDNTGPGFFLGDAFAHPTKEKAVQAFIREQHANMKGTRGIIRAIHDRIALGRELIALLGHPAPVIPKQPVDVVHTPSIDHALYKDGVCSLEGAYEQDYSAQCIPKIGADDVVEEFLNNPTPVEKEDDRYHGANPKDWERGQDLPVVSTR